MATAEGMGPALAQRNVWAWSRVRHHPLQRCHQRLWALSAVSEMLNGFKMIEMSWTFPSFTGLSHSELFLFDRSCLPQNVPTWSSISGLDLSTAYVSLLDHRMQVKLRKTVGWRSFHDIPSYIDIWTGNYPRYWSCWKNPPTGPILTCRVELCKDLWGDRTRTDKKARPTSMVRIRSGSFYLHLLVELWKRYRCSLVLRSTYVGVCLFWNYWLQSIPAQWLFLFHQEYVASPVIIFISPILWYHSGHTDTKCIVWSQSSSLGAL